MNDHTIHTIFVLNKQNVIVVPLLRWLAVKPESLFVTNSIAVLLFYRGVVGHNDDGNFNYVYSCADTTMTPSAQSSFQTDWQSQGDEVADSFSPT